MIRGMGNPSPFRSDALGHGPADRRLAILREIGRAGSISQAARAVGVSYKAAWQALDTLTNLAGVPLVERTVGGAGGGGTRLTPAGLELLAAADAMHEARARAAAGWAGKARAAALGLSVRTSMRNQWPCEVRSLQASGPLVRLELRGAGSEAAAPRLWARITRESCELLALQPGTAVQALCKATAVQVLLPREGGAQAGPNRWPARVRRVARGALGDEVAAQLDTGLQVVGFAPAGSGLRSGAPVVVAVDEAAVALALAPD